MNATLESAAPPARSNVAHEPAFGSRRWLPRWLLLMGVSAAIPLTVAVATPVLTAPGNPVAARPAPLVIAVVFAVLSCIIPVVRRQRIRDAEVLVLVMMVDWVLAHAGMVIALDPPPGGNALLLLLTWPTMMAAVYLSRPMVAAQLVVGSVAGAFVLGGLLLAPTVAVSQILLVAFSLTVVAVVVTQMRESLHHALDRARHAAGVDALTGLANRHGISERMPALWAATARRGERLEVLLVDIDHFKAVNDEHDHRVGDQVLAQVASIVHSLVRADDLVGRFGGEEFLVVASVAAGADPAQVGERIRRAVEEQSGPIPVTVSVGSTSFAPQQGVDLLDAFEQHVHVADRAMYESKRAGRNRVTRR